MAHMLKNPKSACGILTRHFERNENINEYGNELIDKSRSYLNYNLAPERDISQLDFIEKRCSEVKCLNRDDVKVMVTWALTLPKDVERDSEEEDKFFRESYKFLTERYGGSQNVISAYVHKDETTPHMHFAFIPVCFDEKKDIYKVSAKEVVPRSDLKTFHDDLDKYLEKALGRRVEVLTGLTRDGNKSIKDLKRLSAIENLEKMKNEINSLKNEIIDLKKINSEIKKIDEIKTDKKFMSSKLLIAPDDFEKLKNDSKKLKVVESENKKLEIEIEKTINKNINFQKEIRKLNFKIADSEKEKLKLSEKENDFKILNRVLNNNLDLKKEFDLKLNFEKEKIKYEKKFEKLFGDLPVKILKSNSEKLKENSILKLKSLNDFIQNNFENDKKIKVGFLSEKDKKIISTDWNLKNKNFYNTIFESKTLSNILKDEMKINKNNLNILDSLNAFFKPTIEEQEGQSKNRISQVENKPKKKNNLGIEF